MSYVNGTGTRGFKRAQCMKRYDDGMNIHIINNLNFDPPNKTNGQSTRVSNKENDYKDDKSDNKDTSKNTGDIKNAGNVNTLTKYGNPFSLNHSLENGNKTLLPSNTKVQSEAEKNGDAIKRVNPFAVDRFRQATLKAQVASKSEADPNSDTNGESERIVNPFGGARDRFRQAGLKARLAARMEKIVEDRMTIRQIFNRYVDNSTLHGFRFIFMKTFYVRRFLWLILTLGFATLFFSELRNSIKLFYQYPFTTLSTIEFVPNLKFPAISICNLNSFDASKVSKTKLKKLYEKDLFPFPSEPHSPGYDYSGKELSNAINASSQSLEDIFKSCEWKSRDTAKTGKPNPCGPSNFSKYTNMEGHKCFTFNSGADSDILTLNETGLSMAFKLELDIHADVALKSLEEVGIKVVIHDQSETPLHHAGFIVSPGFQTFVEMKVKKTENLKPPYATRCGEVALENPGEYRQSHCFIEQLNKVILDRCGCRGDFMKVNAPLCSLNQTMTCLFPIIHHFDRKTSHSCPVDCNSVQYTTALSYARLLSSAAHGMEMIKDPTSSYINNLRGRMDSEELKKYIEDNIVIVQFFYQEMKEENIKQEPSYDFYKLVGDVGGQLGLMLGASVLTLVEFVDLFFFTLYHQLLRLSRRKKKAAKKDLNEPTNGSLLKSS